jgi:hypothetical protein
MNKGLKWFLGIVIGLVLVAALVGVGFVAFNHWRGSGWMMANRNIRSFNNERAFPWRNMPGIIRPPEENPIRPFARAPLARFGVFRPLPALFGCLVCLGFLILVVLGVVYLVRGPRKPQQAAVGPAPIAPPTTASPAPSPVQATSHPCPHCGQLIQDDWKHCPYCGGPLSEQAQNIPPAS